MTRRLLVVGFGPFPGVPCNLSGALARRVAASARLRRALGAPLLCLVMRTAYAALSAQLAPALRQRPDAVLIIGVARRARRGRVETRARNRVSRLFPDASRRVAARLQQDPDGLAERRSPLAERAVRILRGQGVDACLSREAGRYLCNAAYFAALAEDQPTLFVHIPPLPQSSRPRRRRRTRRQSLGDVWADALAEVALALVKRAG